MERYGMPYKGSKRALAERIVALLPEADILIDAFGGGGAITDCAARSGKWPTVIYNELDPVVYKGFNMAINGEFEGETRWISRDDFELLKDHDPYAAICFSFGTNLRDYAYAPELERFKKHLHYMAFANDPIKAMRHWSAFVAEYDKVAKEIGEITQDALKLCEECGVAPAYKQDGTLDAGKIKDDVFRVKSADIREYMRNALAESGKTQADVDKFLGPQMSGHYFGASQWALPTETEYEKLRELIPGLTIPWAELSAKLECLESLQSLQRLQSLQSLQSLQRLQSLESLQRLQSLESLQRLQSLQSLQRLQAYNITCFNLSYDKLKISPGAVVYCDPPYADTDEYKTAFDSEKFYKWIRRQTVPVFISEYTMPDDFEVVAEWAHRSCLGAGNNHKTIEKIYANKIGAELMKERAKHEQLTLW